VRIRIVKQDNCVSEWTRRKNIH